jgi:hypothetical protein
MSDETAAAIDGEVLRSAFAIGPRHVLTAWHNVREAVRAQAGLWFRLRHDDSQRRHYAYIPVRVSNYDLALDVAALAVDAERALDCDLTPDDIQRLLTGAALPLSLRVDPAARIKIIGFPASAPSADSDTNEARVVDSVFPLGNVVGMKLFGEAFGAASPVDPHGLSGAPVVQESRGEDGPDHCAVGVVRVVPRGVIPRAASGGSLVATRVEDLVDVLPEVHAALAPVLTPTEAIHRSRRRVPNLLALERMTSETMRENSVLFNDPVLGRLVGWAHFYDEPSAGLRPTAISTAYGLKLALVLDDADGRLDKSALVETLWKLRRDDGGWSARTGSGVSRPETTALVLGALASAGSDPARIAQGGDDLDKLIAADRVVRERTYVITAVMRGLVRTRPDSQRLAELRDVLLAGALTDPYSNDWRCWASLLRPADGGTDQPAVPSAPHTAMAVVALTRANAILGPNNPSRSVLSDAVRWLCGHPTRLENRSESIRRPIGDSGRRELLNIDHFTAAWVARALMAVPATDLPESGEALLAEAVQKVGQAQRDGIWHWHDQERPVWMTYQSMCVMRDYAIRTFIPSSSSAPGG